MRLRSRLVATFLALPTAIVLTACARGVALPVQPNQATPIATPSSTPTPTATPTTTPTRTPTSLPPVPTATATPSPTPTTPPTPTARPATPTPSPTRTPAPPSQVTLADDNKTITLHPGNTFLLALGITYTWSVNVGSPSVLSRVPNVTVVRGAQGIYRANQPGQTALVAIGDPACRQAQPPCATPSRVFKVTVVVQ